jgi:hypothetical protein
MVLALLRVPEGGRLNWRNPENESHDAVGLDPADAAQRNAADLATFQPPFGGFIEWIPATTRQQLEQNITDFMRTLNSVWLRGLCSLKRSIPASGPRASRPPHPAITSQAQISSAGAGGRCQ